VSAAPWRWISPRPSENASEHALNTAVRFLAQRPRSEYEVRQRLRRGGADEAVIDGVVGKLRTHGLLDDAAFAEYWVEQRQTFRPRGVRLLRAELAHKGIERALASDVAATVEGTADADAYRAARGRANQLRALDERTFKSRLGQWLGRRGYDWATIEPVVERLWSEH